MKQIPIQLQKKKIDDFCERHHIVYLAIFGSVLTHKFTEESDIDVLVRFKRKHIPHLFGIADMESELSDIINRTVDLKTPNDLSPYFRNKVLAQARKIYGKYGSHPIEPCGQAS